jgi:hypothetical protein
MNRVIIPEEKVRMITNGSHLVILSLNTITAVIIDRAIVVIDRLVGFRVFVVVIIRAHITASIVPVGYTYDLQNQCYRFELLGIFWEVF